MEYAILQKLAQWRNKRSAICGSSKSGSRSINYLACSLRSSVTPSQNVALPIGAPSTLKQPVSLRNNSGKDVLSTKVSPRAVGIPSVLSAPQFSLSPTFSARAPVGDARPHRSRACVARQFLLRKRPQGSVARQSSDTSPRCQGQGAGRDVSHEIVTHRDSRHARLQS